MRNLMLIIILFFFFNSLNGQTINYDYDLSQNYIVCDLTGENTANFISIVFDCNKNIDYEIYEQIKQELDSVMQAAFNSFWDKKYIEYEQTRGINEYNKKEMQIQSVRISLLEAQFKYNEELNIPNDSILISEYCDLIDKNNLWMQGWEHCSEIFEEKHKQVTDSLYIFGTDKL